MMREEFNYTYNYGRRPVIFEAAECHLVATTTLVIAAIAIAAVGAGVGAYSAVQQGKAADDAAKYSADIERRNATVASQKSQYEAERLRKRNVLLRGKQQAAYAKSGVEITGTPEDVMYDSEIEGQLDLLATRYAGTIAASDAEARARLDIARGESARTSSYFSAGASILGGASQSIAAYGTYTNRSPQF